MASEREAYSPNTTKDLHLLSLNVCGKRPACMLAIAVASTLTFRLEETSSLRLVRCVLSIIKDFSKQTLPIEAAQAFQPLSRELLGLLDSKRAAAL